MRFAPIIALLGAVGYLAWQRFKPIPPPPPPPPPPAILSEPAPVVNEAEQARILKSAEDPDSEVRWEAVMLLDKMRAPIAKTLIFNMAQKDLDVQLRVRAITVLGTRKGEDVTKAVVTAMKDQEPEVRLAALRALQGIGDYNVAPLIAAGPVRDSEENVRLQALKTLNSLQDIKQREIEEAQKRYDAEKAAAAKKAQEQQR